MGAKGRNAAAAFWLFLFLVGIAIAQTGTEMAFRDVCPQRGNEVCNGRLVMSLCHTLLAHQESDLPQYCSRYRSSFHYEITTLTKKNLTSGILQNFSAVTAEALNRFCKEALCIVDGQNVTGFQVMAEDVIVPWSTIWINAAGNPVLMFYVETDDGAFVSEETMRLAVESADDLYREANFDEYPELRLWFFNDSPIVRGRGVTAYIESSDQTATMTCRMSKQPDVDCSSGIVHYPDLARDVGKVVTLKVEATTKDGRMHEISRKLRLEEPGYCTVHLINEGVTIQDGVVKIEFAQSGYTVSTDCIMDPPKTKDNPFFECTSPVYMDVGPGDHKFKIIPRGCYDYRFPLKIDFEVLPN